MNYFKNMVQISVSKMREFSLPPAVQIVNGEWVLIELQGSIEPEFIENRPEEMSGMSIGTISYNEKVHGFNIRADNLSACTNSYMIREILTY